MSESKFSNLVCRIIKLAGGDVSRVESRNTSPGIPDLDYCLESKEGHIELKYVTRKKRADVKPTQVRWMRNRVKAGGMPFYLVYNGDRKEVYFVTDVTNKKLLGDVGYKIWAEVATITVSIEDFKLEIIEFIIRR